MAGSVGGLVVADCVGISPKAAMFRSAPKVEVSIAVGSGKGVGGPPIDSVLGVFTLLGVDCIPRVSIPTGVGGWESTD